MTEAIGDNIEDVMTSDEDDDDKQVNAKEHKDDTKLSDEN
jgi:hypothetical protein